MSAEPVPSEALEVGERVFLRSPTRADRGVFVQLMRESRSLHDEWVAPPMDEDAFDAFLVRSHRDDTRAFLACRRSDGAIAGVFVLGQIFYGAFQSAYMGYYAVAGRTGRGLMTEGMRLVLRHAFASLGLHRVEANIQPGNARSMELARRCGSRMEGFSPRYVLARSHYLPLFSRLGQPYPMDLLDRMAYRRPRELFEYWGHEASLMPAALHRLFRCRMARGMRGAAWYGWLESGRTTSRPCSGRRASGGRSARAGCPIPAASGGRGGDGPTASGPWSGCTGRARLAVAERRNFERFYDLPERVLPPEVLAVPTPTEEEAHRELMRMAALALGVATARDLADYFRLTVPETRPRIDELVEEGGLVAVRVEGWPQVAYLASGARLPRQMDARALVSPFDSLVWERSRTERLFGFHLRLEVYVPAPQRRYGYYVLPLLLGDRLVARADLKSDRRNGVLRAASVHLEPAEDRSTVMDALAGELRQMADWLGLDRVESARPRGS